MENNCEELKILVVVGPSGVGKGTLIGKIMNEFSNKFTFSVSHTTRKPRAGEVDGINYHFIEKEEFQKMIEEQQFIEFNKYSENFYGTSKNELLKWAKENKICILDIDINGAKNVLKSGLGANFIAVIPPNFEELKKRLFNRATDSEEVINKRLDISKIEIDEINVSDFFQEKIVNDDLTVSFENFKKTICALYPSLKN